MHFYSGHASVSLRVNLICAALVTCCSALFAEDKNAPLPEDAAEIYAGHYRQPGVSGTIRLFVVDHKLMADIPGDPPVRLSYRGEHEFRPERERSMRIVFEVKDDKAVGYTLYAGEQEIKGQRTGAAQKAGQVELNTRQVQISDGATIQAQLGRLVVPENRNKLDSNLIELAFVRLKSTADKPRSPLVYLAGGPGGSSTYMADNPSRLQRWAPYLSICDVVLLDQRGTGKSSPSLRWQAEDLPPDGVLVDREIAIQHAANMSRRAVKFLRDRGIDLAGYTTIESADDLADLRKALGAEKLSLLGFSYGTHLALATIKRHPEILDNVVVAGVEGLNHTYKLPLYMDTQFRKIARLATTDPGVSSHTPDLTALLKKVLAKLESAPMVVTLTNPHDNQEIRVPVGKFGLQLILRLDIGDASDLPVFPKLLYSIDQGDPSVLHWFVDKRFPMFLGVNGMGFVMDAASGASPQRLQRIQAEAEQSLFGNVMNLPYLEPRLVKIWDAPDLGEDYRAPMVSDVRTLFLSGTLDWNTPPHQAEEVRFGFTNSTHLVVENAGHEQVLPQPAIQKAILAFLRREEVHHVKVVLPELKFVPIDGYDPEATHPSADPIGQFDHLALRKKHREAARAMGRQYMQAMWDDPVLLNNFAWSLVSEHKYEGEFNNLALEMSERSNALTENSNWMFVDTLAHIHFALGHMHKAVELEKHALKLAEGDPRVDEVRRALRRFEELKSQQ